MLQAANQTYKEYNTLLKRAALVRAQPTGDVVKAAALAGVAPAALQAALAVPLVYDARSSFYTGGCSEVALGSVRSAPGEPLGSFRICVLFLTLQVQ